MTDTPNQETELDWLDSVLRTYSFAVQELHAEVVPFDDGVEASRYRHEAKQAILTHLEAAKRSARADERNKCMDETHPLYRGSIRTWHSGLSPQPPEDKGWNEGTLHILKLIDAKHEERLAQLSPTQPQEKL